MASRALLSLIVRRLLQAAVLAGCLALLGAVSNLPLGAPAEHGLLRLAWRTLGERLKICRDLAESEQSSQSHMRLPRTCQAVILPYRLRVSVDGGAEVEHVVLASGARSDRPLYVQEELPLAPGRHHLRVSFSVAEDLLTPEHGFPLESPALGAIKAGESLAEVVARAPTVLLEREVMVRAGRVLLVDLVEGAHEFRVLGE